MKTASCILFLLVAAALTMAAACSRSAFDAQVERAEALMDSAPDSALAIAEALHPGNRAEQARAALLLTKARYKAYVPLTDDSLISIAANYYSGRNDSLETQALFLLGRSLYTKGDYTHALIVANEGVRVTKKNKYLMYEAQFHRLSGDILEQCYDFSRTYFQRLAAAQLFDNAGKASHSNWEILSSIEQLSRLDQVKTAVLKLDSLQRVLPNESDAFKVECHSLMALLRYKTKEYDKALEEYRIVENYGVPLSSHQLSIIANIYINLDSLIKAEKVLALAESTAISLTDSLTIMLDKSQLYAKRGELKAALNKRIE